MTKELEPCPCCGTGTYGHSRVFTETHERLNQTTMKPFWESTTECWDCNLKIMRISDVSNPDAKPFQSHRGGISFRNYCGTLELLIEDAEGGHIVYNKIDGLSREDLIAEYMHEIKLVKHLLGQKKTSTFEKEKHRMYQDNFDKWRVA